MVKLEYVIIFYFFTFIIISTIVCAIAQEGEIMKVRYNGNKEHGYAHKVSFYPNAKKINDTTVIFENNDYY